MDYVLYVVAAGVSVGFMPLMAALAWMAGERRKAVAMTAAAVVIATVATAMYHR